MQEKNICFLKKENISLKYKSKNNILLLCYYNNGDFMNLMEINSLVLAYIGDSVYELSVRKHIVEQKINKVNNLQSELKKYVSATSQSLLLNKMMENDMFDEEELCVLKRARNSKVKSHPKNTDILTYKHATSLEALIGYLYLKEDHKRIEEIMNYIWGVN